MADSNSPPWLKPCEVLRLHKKARRQLQMTSNVLQTIDINKTQPLKTSQEIGIIEEKHVNPFSKSVAKKNMDIYKDYLSGISPQTSITVDLLDENTVLGPPEVKSSKNTLLNNVNKFENKSEWINSIPVDWSLKTKVRFMSTKPFPWRGNLKTVEEASGTTSFTRCLELEQHKGKDCVLDSSPGACFYKNCLYWMHPSLPWLQLFPRMDVKKNKNLNQAITSYNEIIQDSLHSDWCESFRSLYQLVRTCQCPFFYLCAASFTVLFRAAGINGFAEINAMITPTTRGLRQALIAEGINFTMPLSERKTNNPGNEFTQDTYSQLSNTSDESIIPGDSGFVEGNDELASDDEEPGSWLESLGLSQQDFPSLNPNKIKLDKENGKSVDYRPQSLVYVQGMETQALVNFLLNTKLCFSKTGPLTGIPPTLLSPTAFHGGSLQSVKVRQGNVKHNNVNQHVIELNGPIFPSTLHRLCHLLRQTQDGNYKSLLLSHRPTNPFCSVLPCHEESSFSAFAIENLKDCGICKDTLQWMCAKRSADKTGLNEIISINGLYKCT
ncbi:protein downstream neighbor of Son-like [Centruroides sculpturatus]|uniref:protein downstream neighbor of Son-like n=1 Tax=Centruroides sculpturatus TaxID=218467 RepID=UPI000C6DD2E7|nr:protein downstream neighbor of Son-like [Centruroides sculpturatus]